MSDQHPKSDDPAEDVHRHNPYNFVHSPSGKGPVQTGLVSYEMERQTQLANAKVREAELKVREAQARRRASLGGGGESSQGSSDKSSQTPQEDEPAAQKQSQ